jgi:glycosyltransferase involved in cell wall biosynthesis
VSIDLLLDAQSLGPSVPGTGTATYAKGLLGALARNDTLRVRALCPAGAPLPDRVERITVHRHSQRPRARVIENSLRLPLEVRRHRDDGWLYHSLSYHPVPVLPAPWVQTLHDVIPLTFPSADLQTLRRRWRLLAPRYRRADAVIAVSRHAADDGIAQLGLRPDRIHIAPHGVDPSFTPGAGPADPPYLLMVGEFSDRKGFAEAFAVIDELTDHGYPHRLIVVGRDNGRREPSQWRANARHPERVELRGMVDDLVPLYQGATALLMTSRYEGFGLPVLEAMACGVPVVSFDNSALTDLVGQHGVLVADGDVPAMTEALRRVLDSPGLATELRERGLAHAAAYTWERSAAVHVEVYRALAGAT